MEKYNWIFWFPIIGELYLILSWIINGKYPLSISPVISGAYQGLWFALLTSLIIFN